MFVTLLRTVILYLLLVAGFRLLGKRQIGELEPTELVLTLVIADLASVPMQDNGIPLLSGVIPIVTLLCLTMLGSLLMGISPRLRAFLCGRPSILVEHGILRQRELIRNRLTVDELLEELRAQGCTDLRAIQYAVLETNGQLSLLLEPSQRPLTAGQLGLSHADGGLPVVLISDGKVLRHALRLHGLDEKWLAERLQEWGMSAPREVYLLTVDELGQTCLIAKDGTS